MLDAICNMSSEETSKTMTTLSTGGMKVDLSDSVKGAKRQSLDECQCLETKRYLHFMGDDKCAE